MTLFILDASAVLRFLDKEAGWDRVVEILKAKLAGTVDIAISAIQWGEIAGAVRKKQGAAAQDRALLLLAQFQPRIELASEDRSVRAAEFKVDRKVSYADAFAVQLATELANSILVTADYGFKAVADLVQIEFLPSK